MPRIGSRPPRRRRLLLAVMVMVLASCGGAETSTGAAPPLPVFDAEDFRARLTGSERPAVVNVWASWCIPCRSEAPLLTAAHQRFGEQVLFLGVAIEDTNPDAAAFVAEFGIPYDNYLDRPADVRRQLGGTGVPITYFLAPGGDLVDTHFGVIDEQQLALGIDELLQQARLDEDPAGED